MVVNKLEKHHASRPRKVVTTILSSQDKERGWEPTKNGRKKRGEDYHLQRMIWEVVKDKKILHKLVLASFVASHYCYSKQNMVTILEHYTFWKQHSRRPTCQILMKIWIGHAYGSGSLSMVN